MRRRLAAHATAAALALFAGATTGCASVLHTRPGPPCLAGCALAVQNDGGTMLAVRIADSTGKRINLGIVAPRAIRIFRLRWMQSAGIRVYVRTATSEQFDADVPFTRGRATRVVFPADFYIPGSPPM